jgi:hypothetical protein
VKSLVIISVYQEFSTVKKENVVARYMLTGTMFYKISGKVKNTSRREYCAWLGQVNGKFRFGWKSLW